MSDSFPPPPNWGDGPVPADQPKPGSPYPQAPYGQTPYPQGPYGQSPYGQTPYGMPGGTWLHPQGTTVLVLGILSLVICGVLGPVAWIMGNRARAEISQRPGVCTNAGQINAGRICGIIASVFLVVVLVVVIAAR